MRSCCLWTPHSSDSVTFALTRLIRTIVAFCCVYDSKINTIIISNARYSYVNNRYTLLSHRKTALYSSHPLRTFPALRSSGLLLNSTQGFAILLKETSTCTPWGIEQPTISYPSVTGQMLEPLSYATMSHSAHQCKLDRRRPWRKDNPQSLTGKEISLVFDFFSL